MKYTVTLQLLLSAILKCFVSGDEDLIVNTADGSVEGIWKDSPNGTPVRVFYGIPYAIPPLGPRRYRPSEPAEPWKGILQCTKPKAACVQKRLAILKANEFFNGMLGVGPEEPSEDCLTINVYVSKNAEPNSPVMVFFHGGGFALGSSTSPLFDGTVLASEENVVVVSMNYRLASFGYLYLGLDGAPGNMALMDQTLALKWIQRHISDFNGDPERVTLFGHSSGSIVIGTHLLLESSQKLFNRAILQSGSPNAPFAYRSLERQLKDTEEFAANLGCPFDKNNLDATLECFLGKDANELIENEPQWGYSYVYLYTPVVDGKFVTKHPTLELHDITQFPRKQIISGTAMDDTSLFLTMNFPFAFAFKDDIHPNKDDVYDILTNLFGFDKITSDTVYNTYKNVPEGERPISIANGIGNDALFFCPSLELEQFLLANGNKVFRYIFQEKLKAYGLPNWYGAFHGSDIVYVFGHPLRYPDKFKPEDGVLSRKIMKYWANFARSGNPNIMADNEEMDVDWSEAVTVNGSHIRFATSSITVAPYLYDRLCNFWRDVVPKLIKDENSGVFSFLRPE